MDELNELAEPGQRSTHLFPNKQGEHAKHDNKATEDGVCQVRRRDIELEQGKV